MYLFSVPMPKTSGSASIWTGSIGLDRPPVNFVDTTFGSNIREEALLPPLVPRGRKSRKFVGLAWLSVLSPIVETLAAH